jgi:parvulin-like peptidyl-prolyl isomerase
LNRFLSVAFACALAPLASAQTDPNATVLTVNGDTIKASEYYRRMEYLPGVYKRSGNMELAYPPGFLTLEALITERLVFQLARQKGALPSDAEVQAELNRLLTENPKLLTDAALMGQTRADVEHQVRYQLAQFKIATFGVTITDAEVDKFYRDNAASMFTIPKRAKLSVIAVSDEGSKQKVDEDLKAGKAFAEVARTYSEDISKSNGGEFGTVPLTSLPEPVRNAVNATKIGQASAWVGVPNAPTQTKFFLHDVLPEEKIALDAKLRIQIRRRLMLDKGQVRNDVSKEMNEMRAKAKIDIGNKSFAEMYKKYLEEYLKQSANPGGVGG